MDLNQLAVFVRVMESGSFTKAARVLKQPKSRVSRRIAALEHELGVTLLYRTTRQFSPTDAGRALYEKARPHVYDLEEAAKCLVESTGEISGSLKITAADDVGSTLLGPVICEMSDLYPKLSVDLLLSNDRVDLVREGVDLALRIGKLDDNRLKMKLLGRIGLALVASPDYLKRAPRIKALGDLASHPALVFGAGDGATWRLRAKRDERVVVTPRCRANNPKILLELALAGKGVALIPEFLTLDAVRSGKLERVLPHYTTALSPIQFVWPAQREQSPKVKAFLEIATRMLAPYFGGRLS